MVNLDFFIDKKIVVTQVRGNSKLTVKQLSNLLGLGLGKINRKSSLICSESVVGMLKVVRHLIDVNCV